MRQLSVCFSLFLQIFELPQLILVVSAIGYDPRKSQRRHVDSHLRVERVLLIGMSLQLLELKD